MFLNKLKSINPLLLVMSIVVGHTGHLKLQIFVVSIMIIFGIFLKIKLGV
tara:strand:+ start:655 stop:804 length:150 start_codon:yes stop_codon:yes gene_type:complete